MSQRSVGVTIAKNSLWLMLDSLVAFAAAFYCSIAVARGLGPDLMGQYNYILYFATFLRMIADMAIPSTVRKFAAEMNGRGDLEAMRFLIRKMMGLQMRMAAVGAAVGLALVPVLFQSHQRVVAILAVLAMVPNLLLGVPTGALWATQNLRHNVISSLGSTLVNVGGVTLSLLLGWGMVGLVGSLLVSRVVDFGFRYFIFRRIFPVRPDDPPPGPFDPALRRRLVHFASGAFALSVLYSLVYDRMEVLLLKALAPTREIAFFSVSMTVVYYLQMVPQNLSGSASVTVFNQQGRSPEEAARTTAVVTWFVAVVATPLLLGVAAVSDPLLRVLYGTRYVPAIPVLTVLTAAGLGLAISQPAQHLLVGAERQGVYLVGLLAAALLDVLLCVLLIPRHGALGAAIAKGTSQAVAGAGFLGYLVHRFHVTLPAGRMARLFLAGAVMFVAVRVANAYLHGLPALLLEIPLGAAVFVIMARALRCLDGADRERLASLERLVPSPVRAPYRSMIAFLVPA